MSTRIHCHRLSSIPDAKVFSFGLGRASVATCWIVAVGLICFLFADVIFLRTSLAPIDYTEILKRPGESPPPKSIFPERPGRRITDSQGDIGSAAFQFEPSILFLARCLRSAESPFWDPYTATGTVGPETIADIKFSPFSFVVAALGGSARVFSFVLLVLYVCSCYSVLRICTVYFELSFIASVAACLAYFLNGFTLSNLFTAIGQPYFWAPILLLSCLAATRAMTRLNLLAAILAHGCFFANTFFPTAVLCAIVVYGVTLTVSWQDGRSRWYVRWMIIGLAGVFGLGLLGFLYAPIISAHLGYLHNLNEYNARQTPGYSLVNLISLFTPKHVWETERAMHIPPGALPGHYEMEIQYIGIAASLIAVYALFVQRRWRLTVFVLFACVLISFGQIFGIPPFTLIDKLPFFSFIRNAYWSAMLMLAVSFIVGFALDALTPRNALSLPGIVLAGLIAASFFVAYRQVGLSDAPWQRFYICVFWFLLGSTCLLLCLSRWQRLLRWTKPALVVLMFCEGVFYMNGLRPHRENRDTHPPPSIAWLKSQVHDPAGDRVLNIGLTGVFPNWGSALGIPELGDTNLGAPLWYENFYQRYIGSGVLLSIANPDNTCNLNGDALSLAGVRYVVVDRNFLSALLQLSALGYPVITGDSVRVIFENPNPLPRTFVVQNAAAGDELPTGNIRGTVTTTDPSLLHSAQKLGIVNASQSTNVSSAKITAYHHDLVTVECDLKNPGILVLTDAWTPWWSAYADGKRLHLARVDVTFRAVALPAGRHIVEFRYTPIALRIGEWISIATAALLLLGLWYSRWGRRFRLPVRS